MPLRRRLKLSVRARHIILLVHMAALNGVCVGGLPVVKLQGGTACKGQMPVQRAYIPGAGLPATVAHASPIAARAACTSSSAAVCCWLHSVCALKLDPPPPSPLTHTTPTHPPTPRPLPRSAGRLLPGQRHPAA
jgi:hypothetical protein